MKTLDSPECSMQSRAVQLSGLSHLICYDITLDARDQRPTGQLNLARCISPGVAPRGSCLYPDNKGYSHFLLLNSCSILSTGVSKARCGTDSLEKSEAPAAAGLKQLVGALQVKYQLGVTLSAVYLRYTGVQVLFLAPSAGGYAWIVSAYGAGAFFVFSLFLSLLVTWLAGTL